MSGERWRFDPRAPRQPVGFDTEPPALTFVANTRGGYQSPPNPMIVRIPFVIGGKGIPRHLVRVRITEGPLPGQMLGSTTVNDQGTWSLTVNTPQWSGRVCFAATQTWPGRQSSPPSAQMCVQIGGGSPDVPDQTVDFETHPLRFGPENWIGGTLAFPDGSGEWVYGVMRRAVEEPSA